MNKTDIPTKFVKNTGQWHPAVAFLADIQRGTALMESYHGCGDYIAKINAQGEILGLEKLELWDDPQPGSSHWEEGKHALLGDDSPLPELGGPFPCWIKAWGGSCQIGINHGTGEAALLIALCL